MTILSFSDLNNFHNANFVPLFLVLTFGSTSAVIFIISLLIPLMEHEYMLHVTFVASKIVLRHPKRDASKNVSTPTVSEFYEILRAIYISRDDSNGEIRFIIRDPENKFWIFLPKLQFYNQNYDFALFPEIGISRVLHSPLRKRNLVLKFRTITITHMHMQRALYHACKQLFIS